MFGQEHATRFFVVVCNMARQFSGLNIHVPVYSKEEGGRTAKPLVCLPLQMLLTEEVQATRNFDSDLREDAKHLPPVFENHPIVQRHREAGSDRIPVPVALYVDGIGYANKNSLT